MIWFPQTEHFRNQDLLEFGSVGREILGGREEKGKMKRGRKRKV